MQSPFQVARTEGQGVAEQEVAEGDEAVDHERFERGVGEHAAGLVSSVKPMIEVTAVPLTTCTEKPTVGATAMRSACGRIT